MKTAITLILGIVLGLSGAFIAMHLHDGSASAGGFAGLHGGGASNGSALPGEVAAPSPAVSLMQTDTALCDQPYFISLYELSVEYFSRVEGNINAEEFANLTFTHARESGFFTPAEAEGWIDHIKAIPGEFVEIMAEDPTALDTCYDFQVAAVGPAF